jgi:hypothetical protein
MGFEIIYAFLVDCLSQYGIVSKSCCSSCSLHVQSFEGIGHFGCFTVPVYLFLGGMNRLLVFFVKQN